MLLSSSGRDAIVASAPSLPAVPPMRGIERGPYLIIVTPILSVLAEFEAQLGVARTCDPNGASRHTLEHVVAQLHGALSRAEETELWGTTEDVVRHTGGRAKSTVTEWAQNYGEKVWCWKRSGIWAVDLQKFDAWYRDNLTALDKRRRASKRGVAGRAGADSEVLGSITGRTPE